MGISTAAGKNTERSQQKHLYTIFTKQRGYISNIKTDFCAGTFHAVTIHMTERSHKRNGLSSELIKSQS